MVTDLKNKHLANLAKDTQWGKEESFRWKMNDRVKTVILSNTNKIKSGIEINEELELPIIELFLTKYSFVVFTTKSIYSRCNEVTEIIDYDDLVGLNEASINQFGRYKHIPFFCIELIMRDESKRLVMLENNLQAWRTIIIFLSDVIRKNSPEDQK